MNGIKTLTLLSIMMVNISLSQTTPKKRNTSTRNQTTEVKENDFFNFSKAKKIKLELNANLESEFNSSLLRSNNIFDGSLTLYEFLKLSGGVSLSRDQIGAELNGEETYLSLGLNFKKFGNIELDIDSNRVLRLRYEYKKILMTLV
ncbi:hypothetical protein [Streptobacillus moniliformis]|uniref:hypothetical protein n=1 Tax=Streptobacillus moniliformis TaxID=34105 RepID=UPI0007E3DD34|nr:hypothetical protein [Streptobacillus moniliformis]